MPEPHVVLCSGGRTYQNETVVFAVLDSLHATKKITLIVTGGAKGLDTLAMKWADERKVRKRTYYPDWEKYKDPTGRRKNPAGIIRNREMYYDTKPHKVITWPGNDGTRNMQELCRGKTELWIVSETAHDSFEITIHPKQGLLPF